MQIVIELDKSIVKGIKAKDFEFARGAVRNFQAIIADAIRNGTVLPEKHGDLIDRDSLLNEIKALQRSPWHNDERAMHTEYVIHEAVETVRDVCIYREKALLEARGNEE